MQSLALESLGLVGGVTANVTMEDAKRLEGDAIRAVAAQALIDGVASTPQGLAVRDIIPDLDLRDNAANSDVAITPRNWVQPLTNGIATTWLAGEVNTDRQVYRTSRSSDNDKKTFVFYGIRRVNTGNQRTSTAVLSASARFLRSNGSKVVDIWPLEDIDAAGNLTVWARTPILYKKGDDLRIDLRPLAKGSGNNDFLEFMGKVAEPLGQNVTG